MIRDHPLALIIEAAEVVLLIIVVIMLHRIFIEISEARRHER